MHTFKRPFFQLFVLLGMTLVQIPQAWADEPAILSVRGSAQLMVPPDQVTLSLGVVTEANQAKQALADNSKRMQKVIQSILSAGLSKKDYSTSQLAIQPLWSSRPRNADSTSRLKDSTWRSKITGYRVSNTLEVKTKKIDKVGELIASVTKAGVNQVNNIRFGLANPRDYRSQAITQATENARADAGVAAKASGVKVKQVQSITLDSAESIDFIAPRMDMKLMRAAPAEALAPPINAGDVTVRASVSIVYELVQ